MVSYQRKNCITGPESVKGQVFRVAGKAFNQMLEGAGAGIQGMPSSEIYNGLQTEYLMVQIQVQEVLYLTEFTNKLSVRHLQVNMVYGLCMSQFLCQKVF